MQIKYLIILFISFVLLELNAIASSVKDSISFGVDTYADNGNVQVYSPTFSIIKTLTSRWFINAKMRVDGISAASIQALTSASSTSTQSTTNNEDEGGEGNENIFDDIRYAPTLSLGYDDGLNSLSFGAYYSTEADYEGKSLFGSYIRQFNEQNTAFGVSFSQSDDKWKPKIKRTLPKDYRRETKLDVSLNQLISPTVSMQLVYSYMYSTGFLADPYHSVPKITAANLADPKAYELYPQNRSGQALALKGIALLSPKNSLKLSYRYYVDDWKIHSHTVDTEWLHDMSDSLVSGIRLRYYTQTKAYFSKPISSYTLANAGELIAVDYRMTAFDSYTVGIPFIYSAKDGSTLTASIDYYQTSSNENIKYWYNVDSLRAVFTTLTYKFNY
ncbi:DUF3570 domain-containing protein [Sulfurimonas sp.]